MELKTNSFIKLLEYAWKCYMDIAATNPQVIEWDSMCTLFVRQRLGPQWFICDNVSRIMR